MANVYLALDMILEREVAVKILRLDFANEDEFIRRFLLHILPKRFRKIRYGGFLAQAIREDKLEIARQQLSYGAPMDEIELDREDIELDKIEKCPKCHIGTMKAIDIDLNFRRNRWQIYNDSS